MKATGITFKGRHSSEFSAAVKTKTRPVTADVKETLYSAPLADGSVDFSDVNGYGHEFYEDKIIELEFAFTADNIIKLQQKAGRIAGWLSGKGTLVFDDSPLVEWDARILSSADFKISAGGRAGQITAAFRVKPFAKFMYSTMDDVLIGDSKVLIGDALPLGGVKQEYILTSAAAAKTIDFSPILNPGDEYIRPVITVQRPDDGGVFAGSVEMELNGVKVLDIEDMSQTFINCAVIILDLKNYSVRGESQAGALENITELNKAYNYVDIKPGFNSLRLTSSEDLPSGTRISVEFTPGFFFNGDWSDFDAGTA